MAPREQEPPPSPVPSPAAPVSPTFAELFATTNPGERDYSRLLLALCGSLLVIAIAVCGAILVDRVKLPNLAVRTAEMPGEGPLDSEGHLRDVLAGQKQASPWDPIPSGGRTWAQRPPRDPPPNARRPTRTEARGHGRRIPTRQEEQAPDGPPAGDGVDPAYAALWGSGDRYAAVGRRASSEAAREAAGANGPGAPGATGVVLPARLLDRVAGAPARAPVMAVLTRKATVGGHVLPAQTELHGTVSGTGGDETRIYLDFEFARLRDGQTVPVRGVARDTHGRYGIPAKKVFGRNAAGSVGLTSASRALRQVGRLVAGQVGDVAGAGLEEATDSATNKAQRIDPDESILVAEPGLAFAIYVLETG